MRVGLLLPLSGRDGTARDLGRRSVQAEAAGLDLIWLEPEISAPGDGAGDALVAAAFVAPLTAVIRIAACVDAGAHPVHIAEQAIVADNISNGRLVLALRGDTEAAAMLAETLDLVIAATAPSPFRHRGARWAVPGNIAANVSEDRVSVTPQPAQLALPIWVAGSGGASAARERGLSHVSGAGVGAAEAERTWRATEHALGRVSAPLRRPAIRAVTASPAGDFDDEAVVAELRAESVRWGHDVTILSLPPGLAEAAHAHAVERIGSLVRPQLQMYAPPVHLLEHLETKLRPRFPAVADGEVPA